MAIAVLDNKELKLDDTTQIKADDALAAFEGAIEVLVMSMPGYATSGSALLTIKAATELLHWMYSPDKHPKPAEIMTQIVQDLMQKAAATYGNFPVPGDGKKGPTIN